MDCEKHRGPPLIFSSTIRARIPRRQEAAHPVGATDSSLIASVTPLDPPGVSEANVSREPDHMRPRWNESVAPRSEAAVAVKRSCACSRS